MAIEDDVARVRALLEAEDGVRVSVGLFGQPGAGKSSLINALLGGDRAAVSVRNDTTTGREEYEWNGLTLVDLPGYDTTLFPAEGYLERFDVPGFDLLLCAFDGKFHRADAALFREVVALRKVVLFVRTKHDALFERGRDTADLERDVAENVAAQVGEARPVHFTSTRTGHGLAELERAIRGTLGEAKRDRWVRAARARTAEMLEQKKAVCERRIARVAAGAAAGGGALALLPVPGLNLAVDVPALLLLFAYIREAYGLTDPASLAGRAAPAVAPLLNGVARYATTDGALALLGQFAGKQVAQTFARFVPFVGPVIAGTIGWKLISAAGHAYLADCHRVAESLLEQGVVD